MKLGTVLRIGLPVLLTLTACGREDNPQQQAAIPARASAGSATLRQIGQQRYDDYILTLFNESGVVKQGPNRFTLEIRNASTNELQAVDAQLHVETTMEMSGRKPMVGNASIIPGDVPGRYVVGSDFAAAPPVGADDSAERAGRMRGTWKLVVIFHPNEHVEFTANVQ